MTHTVRVVVLIYFALISLISSAVTVRDKSAARRGGRRTRESTLILLSVFGGSAAMFLTVLAVRHKTKRIKFMVGIPIIMLVQAIITACVYITIS